ncbi:hypothetical protein BHE74_00016784, partial [Ensete ventricosum]
RILSQGFGDDNDGELDRSGEPHPEGVHGAGRPLRRRRRHPADALGSAPPRCRRRRTGAFCSQRVGEEVHRGDPELKRIPNLQAELAAASLEALERFRKDSRKTVLRLVDMEASYLTVHFFRNLPREVEKTGSPSAPTIDRYTDGHLRRIASNVWSYISMVSQTLMNSIPKAAVYCQVRVAKHSLLNHFYTQVGKKEVFSAGH